ncbi:MAG: DUF4982 domain-containing protein [Clostridia bacterium]|nr:DUF4982 domain-containing protein [Clostridia bacterium]
MRKEILMNDGWKFHKGDIDVKTPLVKEPIYDQSKTCRKMAGPASYNYMNGIEHLRTSGRILGEKWTDVNLPHDYVVDQDITFEETNNTLGFVKYENAWYRKVFTLPEEYTDKRITLRFDGIAGKSTVYLNGCLMAHNFSSYNTFEIDITDRVFFDKDNQLAVYVNTEEFEGWWYQGGGIYRNVWLTVTEPVAVDLWGVYAPYKKINETDFEINFETTVVNSDYEDREISGESFVIDKDGKTVATASFGGNTPFREKTVFRYSVVVKKPLLWDCEAPELYTVKTVLKDEKGELDSYNTRIGFRTLEFTANDGFYLNGKRTFIKGVCGHQDFGLTGLAVPDNIAKHKISLIKQMGANGYRTTHYQQTESYLDACDEMGLLVMNEARWFESTKESFEQIESLVKRDRNRPSVIMWSTSNEEPTHITENGRRTHRAVAAHIKKFDYTRPVTAAQNKMPDKSTVYGYCDIAGINYNLHLFDIVHKQNPNLPIFASECCATGTTRDWHIESDETSGRIRDYDTAPFTAWYKSRKDTWKHFMERPYIFGAFQWISIDHRGEAMWPAISSKSGAIDMFLQKKSAFYLNKSLWTDEPMAHIVPHWNFDGLEGQDIFVPVYTNCDELELFLNGKSLGRKQIEKYSWGEWLVPFEKGELVCVGYKNGLKVCEDKRVTASKPASFRFTLENEVKPDGNDIALFTCECVDENGNVVPTAQELVTFTVSTEDGMISKESDEFVKKESNAHAVIVGTGSDNTDHNNVTNTTRQMYMGKISVAVKPGLNQKRLILNAYSSNVGFGRITVEF